MNSVYDPINLVGRNFIFNITTGTVFSCIVAGIDHIILGNIPKVKEYFIRRQIERKLKCQNINHPVPQRHQDSVELKLL